MWSWKGTGFWIQVETEQTDSMMNFSHGVREKEMSQRWFKGFGLNKLKTCVFICWVGELRGESRFSSSVIKIWTKNSAWCPVFERLVVCGKGFQPTGCPLDPALNLSATVVVDSMVLHKLLSWDFHQYQGNFVWARRVWLTFSEKTAWLWDARVCLYSLRPTFCDGTSLGLVIWSHKRFPPKSEFLLVHSGLLFSDAHFDGLCYFLGLLLPPLKFYYNLDSSPSKVLMPKLKLGRLICVPFSFLLCLMLCCFHTDTWHSLMTIELSSEPTADFLGEGLCSNEDLVGRRRTLRTFLESAFVEDMRYSNFSIFLFGMVWKKTGGVIEGHPKLLLVL